MQPRVTAHPRHHLQRFMRPDALRYLRPDAARFLSRLDRAAEVYPALARKWDGQPRIPEGEEGGGRFTFGTQDSPERTRVHITQRSGPRTGSPGDGNGDGDGEGESSESDDELRSFLVANNLEGPGDEPPRIPEKPPSKSAQRNAILRSIASFLGRNTLIPDFFLTLMDQIEWLENYQDLIRAARDPPETLEELQRHVGEGRRGYDDHHIIEQTAAERWGLTRSQIDDPSNLVSIPRLKHYQITGWYMTRNPKYGGLSPRDYLSDKSLEERRDVGLKVLELYKVLKP